MVTFKINLATNANCVLASTDDPEYKVTFEVALPGLPMMTISIFTVDWVCKKHSRRPLNHPLVNFCQHTLHSASAISKIFLC